MITGAHALFSTPKVAELQAVLRDVFGWKWVDAHEGWLIFAMPPAEVAVHPADAPSHEITLMCDKLDTTMAELREKGIDFEGEPRAMSWGMAVTMVLPGDLKVILYEPRHAQP